MDGGIGPGVCRLVRHTASPAASTAPSTEHRAGTALAGRGGISTRAVGTKAARSHLAGSRRSAARGRDYWCRSDLQGTNRGVGGAAGAPLIRMNQMRRSVVKPDGTIKSLSFLPTV